MRASELCQLMPDSRTVQLAIKYASRLHLMQLAERIGSIAQLKADEEQRIESEHNFPGYHLDNVINVVLLGLSRWLSWLRHSAHRPGRSVGGAGVQSPGRVVDFVFGFQGRML